MTKTKVMLFATILTIISGCAGSSELIKATSTSVRTDVFKELTNGAAVPPGFTELRFSSTLKTHHPGIYSVRDIHGSADYKLLLNIDGQSVELEGALTEETDGVRYMFSKTLLLKAGNHTVIVALPEDAIAVKRGITLVEGEANRLNAEPVYGQMPGKRRPTAYGGTSFQKGIKGIRLKFQDRYN